MMTCSVNSLPVVLVTGAARRIGRTIAMYLHQQGFRVLIHAHRSVAEASALANQLNDQKKDSASVLLADLSQKENVVQLVADAIAFAGRLDALVNNAAIFSKHEEAWDEMFLINVKVPFWLSHAARPYLASHKGTIINITDTHAKKPLRDYAMYCQTKAALTMQTKALADEFAPDIRVNAVAPGAIIWPEGQNVLTSNQQEKILSKTLLKRHGEPIFIAKAVYSLIDNAYVTGQTLIVDGGRWL